MWRRLSRALLLLVLLLALVWGELALWFDGPRHRLLTMALCIGLLLAAIALMVFARRTYGAAGVVALLAVVLGWWWSLSPSNSRDWQPDVARLPTAQIEGSQITFQNVRNFRYGAEEGAGHGVGAGKVRVAEDSASEQRWVTRSYNLDELVGMDIFFSFWGPTLYGHTIVSWEFSDGQHLAISIETRKEVGEEFSSLGGLFRQFELYYVVADEPDVVGVRANQRGERLELYRLLTPDNGDRAMLLAYAAELNSLAATPRWYNALTLNCTTTIWRHARAVGSGFPLDWRLLANGRVVELAYELGTVNTNLRLDELKRRSDITARARAAAGDSAFSQMIRANLPARPAGMPRFSG